MEWFEIWFDTPYYHLLYNNRDRREAEEFIKKLIYVLKLPPKAKIVDLACGRGRHSVFLHSLGYEVLGLDLSLQSILHNKKYEKQALRFRVHDIRDALPEKDIEAVFSLFTSFGYFGSEEEDIKVFSSVYNGLKPQGIFVLDFLNRGFVENNFKPHSVVKRGEIIFDITRKIEKDHVIKKIEFSDRGQNFSFVERVRLHSSEDILKYAQRTNFERLQIWGDYRLGSFDPQISPRCISLFRKK
ncbi:MAG: methyltransferase domain-containing protein [Bergeyella sp.]|nr:methyltransferase domain-containing protein [Bergeyella sp.]